MRYTDIIIRIRQIVRSVNLESKRIEKEHGISIPQLLCLNYLNEKEDFQASQREIKDFLQLNASTVTGIIKRLESKGMVARIPNRTDKRVGIVSITAKGSEVLKSTPEPLHDQLSSRLQSISEAELTRLQEAFDTITAFLNIGNVEASPIITARVDPPAEE